MENRRSVKVSKRAEGLKFEAEKRNYRNQRNTLTHTSDFWDSGDDYMKHTQSLGAKNSSLDWEYIEGEVFLHLLLIRQYPLLWGIAAESRESKKMNTKNVSTYVVLVVCARFSDRFVFSFQ